MELSVLTIRFALCRWCLAAILGGLLGPQIGCSIHHSGNTTVLDLGCQHRGCQETGCLTCAGRCHVQEGYTEVDARQSDGQPSWAFEHENACEGESEYEVGYHANDERFVAQGPIARALATPTIGPAVQAALFEDTPEVVRPPLPQVKRYGPRFVPVPTLPVFGPGTEPPSNQYMAPPPVDPGPEPLQEMPPPLDQMPPPRPYPMDGNSTQQPQPRQLLAEPARLAAPAATRPWTFQPGRTLPPVPPPTARRIVPIETGPRAAAPRQAIPDYDRLIR
ncbi:MAG: hypothetical protein AB7O62_04150 [Pirellulales bacterium]